MEKKKIIGQTKLFVICCFVLRPVAAGALGKSVCQDMWNKAENNLVVGMDLKVDKTSPQGLFQLLENGKTKTKKNEFVTFAGS